MNLQRELSPIAMDAQSDAPGAPADRGAPGDRPPYALVHLVYGESLKDLIIPQVMEPMGVQARTPGDMRPARVLVGFLEPMRVALRHRVRAALQRARAGTPEVQTALLPFVSRASREVSARWMARTIRRAVGRVPIVFHCRGEGAGLWAEALARHLPHSGIVLDVRGPAPEDLMHHRGFDGPELADELSVRDYHLQAGRLHQALARSDFVLTVSSGMVGWLRGLGVPEHRLRYVPCGVAKLSYDPAARQLHRMRLGVGDGVLFAALIGRLTNYQHLEDAIARVFGMVHEERPSARLLVIANDATRVRSALASAGIASEAVYVEQVAHQEVGALLSAADCGFTIYAPSRMQRLVQPVKLGEFLSSGVPVLVAPGTTSFESMVCDAGAGIRVDCFGVDSDSLRRSAVGAHDLVRRDRADMRRNSLALCEREFLWSRHVTSARTAYARALAAANHPSRHA
jgi:hypothetical protein